MLEADQFVGVAAVPSNVTALVPCVDPKFAPAMVTVVPTAPLDGDRLTIVGPGVVAETVAETSAEYGLIAPTVLYARMAKSYVCPAVTVITALVTLPTSIVVVYEPLVVPYDTEYPAMFGSGFGFHMAVTVAACS